MENRQRTSMLRWLGTVVGICCVAATVFFTAYVNELPDYSSLLALSTGPVRAEVTGYSATEDICVWGVLQKLRWERIYAFVILLLMVSYSFALIIERCLKFSIASKQSRDFLSRVTTALQQDRLEDAIGIAGLYPESPVALVVDASFQEGRTTGEGEMHDIRPSMHARQRAIVFVTERMKRGVWTLNALGWSVPLVSLFLSVSGVVLCLKGMKAAEGIGIAAIAGGLAESLWPTAFAMLATIPIVWSQKYFGLKVDTFLLEMDRLSLALIEEIVDRHRSILLKTPTSTQYVTRELHLRPTLELAFDNRQRFRHHAAP